MDNKVLERIVEEARKDPQFFHALVFDTEKVLGKLDYLDRKSKASLVAISPEAVIGSLVGLARCGHTCSSSCSFTCGAASCGYTTALTDIGSLVERQGSSVGNLARCGHTCSSSCSFTCGAASCGHTTSLTDMFEQVQRF